MQAFIVRQVSRRALSQGLSIQVLQQVVRCPAATVPGYRVSLTCEKRVLTTVGVTARPTDVVLSLILIATVRLTMPPWTNISRFNQGKK